MLSDTDARAEDAGVNGDGDADTHMKDAGLDEMSDADVHAHVDIAMRDANANSATRVAALRECVAAGDVLGARALLETGTSLQAAHAVAPRALPLLQLACKRADVEMVRVLLAHGADVNERHAAGITPLLLVCDSPSQLGEQCRDIEPIVDMLLSAGADVRLARSTGWTALHSCASHKYIAPRVLGQLIQAGADPNSRFFAIHRQQHVTPLWCAWQAGLEQHAQLLLDYGATLDFANEQMLCATGDSGDQWRVTKVLVATKLRRASDCKVAFLLGLSQTEPETSVHTSLAASSMFDPNILQVLLGFISVLPEPSEVAGSQRRHTPREAATEMLQSLTWEDARKILIG